MSEFDYPPEQTEQDAEIALWIEFTRGANMRVEIVAEMARKDFHRPILHQNWAAYIASDPTSRINTRLCCYLAGVVSAALAEADRRTCIVDSDIAKAAAIVKARRGGTRTARKGRQASLVC